MDAPCRQLGAQPHRELTFYLCFYFSSLSHFKFSHKQPAAKSSDAASVLSRAPLCLQNFTDFTSPLRSDMPLVRLSG